MGNLLTLHEAKLRMNIQDDSHDMLFNTLIADVSSIIEGYCGRTLTDGTYVEYKDGGGNQEILTDEWPIISITSIYDDVDREYPDISLIDSDDYTFYPNEGKIVLMSSTIIGRNFRTVFYNGKRNVKITYVAGYTTIPGDIKIIASEILMKKFKNIIDRRIGISSISSSGENFSIALSDLLPDHKMILNGRYRHRGTS